MILGKITDIDQQADLPAALRAIVKQALALAPETLEPGRYEIDSEDIFINVMAFETADAQSKRYEHHRDYADIQIQGKSSILIMKTMTISCAAKLNRAKRFTCKRACLRCFCPANRISRGASQLNHRQ